MITKLDINFNGYVDYTEFLAGCMKSKIYLQEDYLVSAFTYFDKDQNGTISIDELKTVLGGHGVGITDKDIELLMKEVDLNKDNEIDYHEFLAMMKRDLRSDLRRSNMTNRSELRRSNLSSR